MTDPIVGVVGSASISTEEFSLTGMGDSQALAGPWEPGQAYKVSGLDNQSGEDHEYAEAVFSVRSDGTIKRSLYTGSLFYFKVDPAGTGIVVVNRQDGARTVTCSTRKLV